MPCCRICGEEKEKKEFYKLKYFSQYFNAKKIWCRDCMKMYMNMQKNKDVLDAKLKDKTLFIVSFI